MYSTDIYGTLNLCQTLCWGLYMNYFILYFTAAIRKSLVPFYRESGSWCQHQGWNLCRVKIILANTSGLYRFRDLQCFLTLEPVLLKSKLFLKHHAYSAAAAAAKSLQSCPTLCDPIDGSLPGSPVPGILQARTLKWVAISFSNAWKWKVKVKSLSHVWLFTTPWTAAYQAPLSIGFSRQDYWSRLPLPSPHTYSRYHYISLTVFQRDKVLSGLWCPRSWVRQLLPVVTCITWDGYLDAFSLIS